MAIIVLALLLALVIAALAYPLFSPQAARAAAVVTDRDIERAVRRMRAARDSGPESPSGLRCPTCAQPYVAGDRFCVKCGADLPAEPAVARALAAACPACGAPLRPGDVFCSKCGHRLAAGEGA